MKTLYLLSVVLPLTPLAGLKVVQLEYEAYSSMAMKQMKQICETVRDKWQICKIAIVHRTGYVSHTLSLKVHC